MSERVWSSVRAMRVLAACLFVAAAGRVAAAEPVPTTRPGPRIVNIYNFIRNSDYRLENSEDVLYGATWRQIEMLKAVGMPATWALQYDALINPRYQKLLKEQLGSKDEIAAWWELPRPLVEKAGIKWRGHHDWDSTANIGFSPGYTAEERRKLVDVYMADFKEIFGYYPRSVGSWYIDEVTLAYMVERYGIVASCNCKDQVGTDGYTLWGGYWNQAYYPSKLNAYMPAQTKDGQIDVPIFRMLGSDPIYQYGAAPQITSMEPVYPWAGGSVEWVEWFMRNLIHQPSLAFAYTQAGQENSFGWDAMRKGYTLQVALLGKQARAGEIELQTLSQSGEWFRKNFPLTPATSFVCLDDWKGQGRKTAWYNSRFFRANFLWEGDILFIRDIHRFDEQVPSANHDSALLETSLTCGTLPVMDGSLWSGKDRPGIHPKRLSAGEAATPLKIAGPPTVRELNATDLEITQPLADGGVLKVVCTESALTLTATDAQNNAINWALDFVGGDHQKAAVQKVSPEAIIYQTHRVSYRVGVTARSAEQTEGGAVRISADNAGKLVLDLAGK